MIDAPVPISAGAPRPLTFIPAPSAARECSADKVCNGNIRYLLSRGMMLSSLDKVMEVRLLCPLPNAKLLCGGSRACWEAMVPEAMSLEFAVVRVGGAGTGGTSPEETPDPEAEDA